jgi:hypothetical protein
LTSLSLKSARSLDLVKIQIFESDSLLSAALGTSLPVYSSGWFADFSERGAEVFASGGSNARPSLAMRVDGPGIVSVQWSFAGNSREGILKLFVDGRERERLDDGNGSPWMTVAVNLATSGTHTLEFRLEPSGIDGLAPGDFRVGLRDFESYPGFPQLQPDLAIAKPKAPFIGTGQIDPTGQTQTVRASTSGSAPVTFRVRWRKRASELADGARLSGPAGDPRYRVGYFAPGIVRLNVTSAVVGGLWETRFAPPGAGSELEISVRRTSKKRPRTGFSGTLRGSSLLRDTRSDRVGFLAIPR